LIGIIENRIDRIGISYNYKEISQSKKIYINIYIYKRILFHFLTRMSLLYSNEFE